MTTTMERPLDTAREEPRRRHVGLLPSAATLSARKITGAVRSGDLTFAVLSPVLFLLCFYTPLHHRFDEAGGDYAQYLTPIVLLQAGLFAAINAAEVAGSDSRVGLRERLASLPIHRSVPALARTVWAALRVTISAASGIATGYALGFRFHGSAAHTLGFVALVVVFGTALSAVTDLLGSRVRDANGVAALLMIPQLILVMASTGLVPAEGFPSWAQPFVRNQPLSVFAGALRHLAEGQSPDAVAVLAWCVGLLVAGALALAASSRLQVGR